MISMVLFIYKKYEDIFPKIRYLIESEKKTTTHIAYERIALSNNTLAYTEVTKIKRMSIQNNKTHRCVTDSDVALQLITNVCTLHGG